MTKRDIINVSDCVTGNVRSSTERQMKLSHTWVFTPVNTEETPSPESGVEYYTLGLSGYDKVGGTGHISSFSEGTTYYTKNAKVLVDGYPIAGVGNVSGGGGGVSGGGTSIPSIMSAEVVTTSEPVTVNGIRAWSVFTGLENAKLNMFSAYVVVNGYAYPNAMAELTGDSSVPVIVPISSLIIIDESSNNVYLRVPSGWVVDDDSSAVTVIVQYVSAVSTAGVQSGVDNVEFTVDMNSQTEEILGEQYWKVVAEESLSDYQWSVVIKYIDSELEIVNPLANIAPSSGYNPIYVPASSLLIVNGNALYVKVPASWMKVHPSTSQYSVIVRGMRPISDE